MVPFGRALKVAAAFMVLATAVVIVIEMEIFCDPSVGGSGSSPRMQHRDDIMINPFAQMPNEGRVRKKDGVRIPELSNDVGTRSAHNGAHQRERQLWLEARAECIRNGGGSGGAPVGEGEDSGDAEGRASLRAVAAGPGGGGAAGETGMRRRATVVAKATTANELDRNSKRGSELVGNGGSDESAPMADGARNPRASHHSNSSPTPSLRRGAGGGVGGPGNPSDEEGWRSSHGGIDRQEKIAAQVEEGKMGGRRDSSRLLFGDADSAPQGQGGTGSGDAERRATTAPVQDGVGGGCGGGGGGDGDAPAPELPLEERLGRLEMGVELWGATYVPPIAPEEKQRLAKKWTIAGEAGGGEGGGDAPSTTPAAGVGAPRILFVLTSFDRGRRLGPQASGVDKLDYLLMIMDEIREACEAGFSPHAHLISAWDPWPEYQLFLDRLFCKRIGGPVPLSLERHPPSIREVLSIKHRIYMKPRVKEYDLFIQMEDDMILTVNHILRYLEESEKLSYRKPGALPKYDFMPGFVRVEPEPGATGVGGEWFEWEIVLSRFRGVYVSGAGTYLGLEKSRVLPYSGNNQGFWMATQEQLKYLQRQCQYLRYTEKSSLPFVEKFSGSLEMFSPVCHNTKVFPADTFENFLVHHRTNNKNGKRGESNPAVSVSMMRLWASQVLRDEEMLMEVGDTGR